MQVRYKHSIVNTIQVKKAASPETWQQEYYKVGWIDLRPLDLKR